MNDRIEELQKILGGVIEQKGSRVIPGTRDSASRQTIYFSDDGKNKLRKQFKDVTSFTDPPNAANGGIAEGGCTITPPGGPAFHAAIFHGDLAGWRKDLEGGAKGLGLLLARIEGEALAISDGRSVPLAQCNVEFN